MTNKECCAYYPKCNCPALLSRIKQLEELGDRAFLVARDADSAQKAASEMLAAMEAKFHGANGSLVACRQREDNLIADLAACRAELECLRKQVGIECEAKHIALNERDEAVAKARAEVIAVIKDWVLLNPDEEAAKALMAIVNDDSQENLTDSYDEFVAKIAAFLDRHDAELIESAAGFEMAWFSEKGRAEQAESALAELRRHIESHHEQEQQVCGYKKLIDTQAALDACREVLEVENKIQNELRDRFEALRKERDEDLVKARAMLTAMRGIVGKRLGHSAYCVTVECTCPPEDVAFFNALGAAESAAREDEK